MGTGISISGEWGAVSGVASTVQYSVLGPQYVLFTAYMAE